jgi:Family of unknown function (DUF5317)
MSTRSHPFNARSLRLGLWLAGLVALLAAMAGWLPQAQPSQSPWALIVFVAMAVVDDLAFGSPEDATWGELPKVALVAAIIVFRRHPEVTVVVAFTAGPLASLMKWQSWRTQVTVTAQWILGAVVGSGVFLLIGFSDTEHFLVATGGLIATYYLMGPVLSSVLQTAATGVPLRHAFVLNRRLFVVMEIAGAVLALAWRTPFLEQRAVDLGELAVVAVAGAFVGFLFGGRVSHVYRNLTSIPKALFVAVALLIAFSEVPPIPWSWLLPLVGLIISCAWAIHRGWFGAVCAGIGGICNELVRAFNGGRMPIDIRGLPTSLRSAYAADAQHSAVYVVASSHSRLLWLGDRFHVLFGLVSVGDLLIYLGAIWLITALMTQGHPSDNPDEQLVTRAA